MIAEWVSRCVLTVLGSAVAVLIRARVACMVGRATVAVSTSPATVKAKKSSNQQHATKKKIHFVFIF